MLKKINFFSSAGVGLSGVPLFTSKFLVPQIVAQKTSASAIEIAFAGTPGPDAGHFYSRKVFLTKIFFFSHFETAEKMAKKIFFSQKKSLDLDTKITFIIYFNTSITWCL